MMPREIMIDTPISQISEFEKLLSASAMAPPAVSLVTRVSATSAIATIDSAPIGMALPMMAAMVPTNSASRCQASDVTPSGTGTTNQINRPSAMAMAVGSGLNPMGSPRMTGAKGLRTTGPRPAAYRTSLSIVAHGCDSLLTRINRRQRLAARRADRSPPREGRGLNADRARGGDARVTLYLIANGALSALA